MSNHQHDWLAWARRMARTWNSGRVARTASGSPSVPTTPVTSDVPRVPDPMATDGGAHAVSGPSPAAD